MTLANTLREYIAACFTGLWIESHEHEDALAEIARLCHDQQWQLATWNVASRLQAQGTDIDAGGTDPLAAIPSINALATPEGTAILVLQNFHRFLQSAEIVQALVQQIVAGRQNRTFVIVLSATVSIPTELEKLMVVIEHELPDRSQLAEIARGVATEEGELPEGTDLETILDAAVGLTRYEAEAAFALSLVRESRLTAETLWQQKAQMLKKSGLLSLHRGTEDFSSLGGLAALKSFCKRSLLQPSRDNPLKRPRGTLLLGGSRHGKKCLRQGPGPGNEPADTDPRYRRVARLTGGPDGTEHPTGAADRRRHGGGHTGTILYSLVDSCKANRIHPYHYLEYVYTRLPVIRQHASLLPLLQQACAEVRFTDGTRPDLANLQSTLDCLRVLKNHPRSLIELMRDPSQLEPAIVAELTALLPDRWHDAHPKFHLEINRKTRLVGEAA